MFSLCDKIQLLPASLDCQTLDSSLPFYKKLFLCFVFYICMFDKKIHWQLLIDVIMILNVF